MPRLEAMWVLGQWIGREVVARIRATVKAEPEISRRALSKRVCEWLNWRGANGKLRDVGCRKALLELERLGHVELPACGAAPRRGRHAAGGVRKRPAVLDVTVRCSLAGLGGVDVVPVSSRYGKQSRVWNHVMEKHHYLGSGPLCGAQVRYLVQSTEYGCVGALSFSAASWRLKSRDEWIGWTERARRANLDKVVCNSRFLIVPGVKVPHLASHVLSLSARRLGADWRERYGYEPVLLESFVDGQRFAGTCYQAANWQKVGQTAGRKDGFENGKVTTGKKDIYVYPLIRNWSKVLCQEPSDPLALRTPIGEGCDWAEEEFAGARLSDERLRKRLYRLGRDFFAQPGVLIPQVCDGSEASAKAAYRFFANKHVDMRGLLRGHLEATAKRVSEHKVVLAVQDTTTLNYTAHPSTEGLGPINTTKDHGVGLVLHDTMAFSTEGTPLGLLDVQCWARAADEAGKSAERSRLPIEEKESAKWLRSYRAVAEVQALCPQTLLVSVGDREADIHELFLEAQHHKAGPKLLVRAERSRNRKVLEEDETASLWGHMSAESVAGYVDLQIPRKGSRAARKAVLEVRHAKVTLRPPQGKKLDAVEAWAVFAKEVYHGPEVTSPLEWMLLTTVAVVSFEDAAERLRWYSRRWGIEVYHRVIKSGCRIEDRQLGEAERIECCLAVDLVVAWRIYWLVRQGRETPAVPCDVFFEKDEWQVLWAVLRKESPPKEPPPLREAVRMVAKLGGFLGRKCDGEPGTTTMWRGLERLDAMAIGWRARGATHTKDSTRRTATTKASRRLPRQRDGP